MVCICVCVIVGLSSGILKTYKQMKPYNINIYKSHSKVRQADHIKRLKFAITLFHLLDDLYIEVFKNLFSE